jgi:hypothetical protein
MTTVAGLEANTLADGVFPRDYVPVQPGPSSPGVRRQDSTVEVDRSRRFNRDPPEIRGS